MPTPTVRSIRLLPDGTPLQNRLLAALPARDYARLLEHLHMNIGVTGRTLQQQGTPVTDVYFPNGGVFSVTNEMRDGALVEVATVGREGMLGIAVFLGDYSGAGRTFQQVPDGPFPSMSASRFVKESTTPGPFRDVVALYAQANLLQIMQCTACNALHSVKQRCCRWLLETQDRVGSPEFLLKQQFLAIMLGVQRPTVTLVMRALQDRGLITTKYGRIRVLKRRMLEKGSCECYEVIRAHFQRLGLLRPSGTRRQSASSYGGPTSRARRRSEESSESSSRRSTR
jgi:CRP-like cAMP-binding protein